MAKQLFKTKNGIYYIGKSDDDLPKKQFDHLQGKIQLIFTSPPFPLNKKKKYGNKQGDDYKKWFISLSNIFKNLLTDDGSIVIELGNSWEPNRPIQSLLHMEALLGFINESNLNLCQEFICYNPSRLPSPAQWVTINRIRTIDSYTRLWWISKSDFPKADNSKVVRPYSESMNLLLKKQKYNAGKRPSEHKISETSFLKKHPGSIMPNVIELEQIDDNRKVRLPENMLSISNSKSKEFYLSECKRKNITPHPARMPIELASFFINFLTDEADIVLDPFAGTNTTGFAAELLKRKWIGLEANPDYGKHAKLRFKDPLINKE